jgi:hypothetical protein
MRQLHEMREIIFWMCVILDVAGLIYGVACYGGIITRIH